MIVQAIALVIILYVILSGNYTGKNNDLSCKLASKVISVDTQNDTYDLLMSFSTYQNFEQCYYKCTLFKNTTTISGLHIDNYKFKGEYYTFLKFPGLLNYDIYSYECNSNSTNEKGVIQFPKGMQNLTRIIAFGDWSKTDKGTETLNTLKKHIPTADAIIFLGDMAYDLFLNFGQVGNDFLNFSKDVTGSIPFQITTGNHEVFDDFSDITKRFYMPNKILTNNLYYSFDVKNAHFVSVNSEAKNLFFSSDYFTKLSDWLEKDLKASDKRWKFLYLHRPLYCSWNDDYHCGSGAKSMRTLYENIASKFKVDMIIAGHTHAYERMYPILNGNVDINSLSNNNNTYTNPEFPVHIICGSGGNSEEFASYNANDLSKITFSSNGICELEITDNKLELKFYDGMSNEVKDTLQIIKNK